MEQTAPLGVGRTSVARLQRRFRQGFLLVLPPCTPELNPREYVGDELRGKVPPNRVFNHQDAIVRQLEQGLPPWSQIPSNSVA